jgi:hypothetical protein
VMCVLYAGLKHLDPTKSVEIDLHTAYEKALARHRSGLTTAAWPATS